MDQTGLTPQTLIRLMVDNGADLKETDSRTNLLVLGIGGGNHEGADLTDTMMLMSLRATDSSMALISIPRDTWSDTLKDKVNSAYHYGEEKKKGGGMILAKVVAEDVLGVQVHYGVVIDFSEFKKLIDTVGGLDINVPQAFTDNDFPIEGKENDTCGPDVEFRCRYESVTFVAGLQHLDGQRALIYVRSRHADGDEGSDFARSRRQQDVILALKNKIINPRFWLSPKRDSLLFKSVDDATDSDMNIGEFLTAGKMIARVSQERTKKITIDQLLENPPQVAYGGRYVLVPNDNWDTIHTYINQQLGIY